MSVSKLVITSYAKLNLYLEVLNKRPDNYHNIKTVFERIDLADKIILKTRPDNKIRIISNYPDLPTDSSNLAFRSARLLKDKFNILKGIEIKIKKNIPLAAGLGGGSSNAAAVLSGLNRLWKLNLKRKQLLSFACRIGSDVPFFIYNLPFAQGSSRGDKIKPLKALNKLRIWHILVLPEIKVSSRQIYRAWDTFSGLTRPKYNVKILPLALKKKDLSLITKTLFNNLEAVTFRLYPQLLTIKEKLQNLGLKSILMSGSGPAIFGMVSSRKEAYRLKRQLVKDDKSLKVLITRTR